MLRMLFKSDLSAIVAIEQSVHISPWTDETFLLCFKAGYLGWVIEKEGAIIGFIIASLKTDECHVLNLCVARDHQHQGYGRQLLTHALQEVKKAGAGIVYLEVRRSNSRAISLYRKMKFHLIGERKNYYPTLSGVEDALVFAKSLANEG